MRAEPLCPYFVSRHIRTLCFAAPVKTEFCKAFDPDAGASEGRVAASAALSHVVFLFADVLGVPCGYGNAFNTAIGAIVIIAILSLAAWFYMPGEIEQVGASCSRL